MLPCCDGEIKLYIN